MGGHLSHLEREKHSEKLNATCGPIQGNVYRIGDKTVDGYLGIPFAKPLVRFKKPEPAGTWEEVRDCTKYGPRCPQSGPFAEAINFQKDDIPDEANCLTLNVFSKISDSKNFNKTRPVMVYIHGGGYECSASRDYCDYSVAGTLPLKDVVVVTLNYRVGILGFFTTGDTVCPGNFALWDLTLGLNWIQKHIESFGGDPGNITIFGQSAGAACVDLLALSPHSRDLFNRVIVMSGGALCEYAVRTANSQAKVCYEFARHLGYDGTNSQTLFNWMKSKPLEEIEKMNGFQVPASGILAWTPNLDDDFFPKSLDELRIGAPKKDIMMGFAEHEGLFFEFLIKDPTPPLEALKLYVNEYYKKDTGDHFEATRNKIIEFYSRNVEDTDEKSTKERLIDFVGDALFTAGVFDNAKNCLKHGNNVWLYIFDYCNPSGFGNQEEFMTFVAPTHCTDLRYVLGEGLYSDFQPTEEEHKMIEKMTTIYSNFAKYGNPNEHGSSEWEKFTLDNPRRHFQISYPRGKMRNDYHPDRMKFLELIRAKNQNLENVVYGRGLNS